MKKLLIALILIVVVLVLAWWSLPAETVWSRVSTKVPLVKLQGVTGRVWQGQAQGVSVRAIPLGAATWSFSPVSGLSGRAEGTLTLSGGSAQIETRLNADRQQVTLSGTKVSLPAKLLEPALDIPALRLLGNIDIEASEVVLEQGVLKRAQGFMQWQDLGVSGLAEARLGGVRMDFAPDGDSILGTVKDLGGPLAIDGTIRLNGQIFVAEINLDARDDSVREALLYIGERKANGGSLLRVEGTVEKLF